MWSTSIWWISAALTLLLRLVDAKYLCCQCQHYPMWNVTGLTNATTNIEATNTFQQWLSWWQFDPERCANQGPHIVRVKTGGGGLGHSFSVSFASTFFLSLEKGQIFRPSPSDIWTWADSTGTNCTLHIPSIDCWSLPLSTCGVPTASHTKANASIAAANQSSSALALANKLKGKYIDICTLATEMSKPTIWIYGQVVYFMSARHSPETGAAVMDRVRQVFGSDAGDMKAGNSGSAVIAVQIRAGKPDNNRQVAPFAPYIELVDEKASHLASVQGGSRAVAVVYLASQDPASSFNNGSDMNARFPRPWKWVSLPATPQNGKEEIEHLVHRGELRDVGSLAKEYLADVEIMVKADVFIGSFSAMYLHVSSLRYALHSHRSPNNTCYVHWNGQHTCNDAQIWKAMVGGVEGGVPFPSL